MRGGPSFFDVEHRLKQLSGLGDYPEEYRQRSVTRYFGPISRRRYSEGAQGSDGLSLQ